MTKFLMAAISFSVLFSSSNAKAEMLDSGVILGVGGNYVASKSKSGDTQIDSVIKKNYGLGGYISLGYLVSSSFEGGLELGYREFKIKPNTNAGIISSVEDMLYVKIGGPIGLLVGSYYIDMDSVINPYIKAGLGLNIISLRVDEKLGVDNQSEKKTTVAYKAGVGVSTVFSSMIIGVGYEFFGTLKKDWPAVSKIDFAQLVAQKMHSVEAFVKIKI